MPHRSGFVNIIGKPNVGKSTLMNALVGEKLSIVTPKPQTTRHRIIGLLNGDDYQVVFSDTPGIIAEPQYALHHAMMRSVLASLKDADIILYMTDVFEKAEEALELIRRMVKTNKPLILIINKIDLLKDHSLKQKICEWKKGDSFHDIVPISAQQRINIDMLLASILKYLPEHPPYYPKDELTDRNVRYFVAEIIREKIFLSYRQEIPYSCEVVVTDYKEAEDIDRIRAEILVERDSQKAILIGRKGSALKKVGIAARADIERLIGKKIYLELSVKVREGWRDDERTLKSLGY